MRQARGRRASKLELNHAAEFGITGESEREEQIIAAAVSMFWEKGYAETSIQDIADAINIGKSSIYHYIQSKEHLLYQIHDTFINHLNERISALAESDLNPEDKLEAIIIDAIEIVAKYKPLVAIFISERRSLSQTSMARIVAKRDRYEQTLTRVIAEGSSSGAFDSDNAKISSMAILGMLNWAHQWLDPAGPLSPEEIGRQMARLVLGGLRTGEGTHAH